MVAGAMDGSRQAAALRRRPHDWCRRAGAGLLPVRTAAEVHASRARDTSVRRGRWADAAPNESFGLGPHDASKPPVVIVAGYAADNGLAVATNILVQEGKHPRSVLDHVESGQVIRRDPVDGSFTAGGNAVCPGLAGDVKQAHQPLDRMMEEQGSPQAEVRHLVR